ncbi:MAG: hypothetical protein K6A92_12900 [Lachnospiraceae bacterium]|nr:hypothetical protein [Lachnospiraceae bacterium]
MKTIRKYPFLTAFITVMILGFLIGVIKAALYPRDVSLTRYFAWHLAQPFWTELLPDYTVEGRSSLGLVSSGYDEEGLFGEEIKETEETTGALLAEDAAGDGEDGTAYTGDSPATVEGDENAADGADVDALSQADRPDGEATAPKPGVTAFVSYEPVETDSRYYTDRGQIALTTEYPYETVGDDYFADAAFIGDSRTLGLHDYSGWKDTADFYCENGFSIYRWTKGEKVTLQSTGKKVDLTQALQEKKYGKIYIMAGMNDLGYGNTEFFGEWFDQFLTMVKTAQPQAVIYLMANLHISEKEDGVKEEMNNLNVNDKNATIATFADGVQTFYLDENPLFCDERGYLTADITFDGFHLYAAQYPAWTDFLKSHGVTDYTGEQ